MEDIAFIDLEIDGQHRIVDIGAMYQQNSFHQNHIRQLIQFITPADYLCGHHFLAHDYPYLKSDLAAVGKTERHIIDTLLLSPLLFPTRIYHALDKDYKMQFEASNNPLNDCQITQKLLADLRQAFETLPLTIKQIFYQLLHQHAGFSAFFKWIGFKDAIDEDLSAFIGTSFNAQICENAPFDTLMHQSPVELAYALAMIHHQSRYAITPIWLQRQYPKIERILWQLRATPCQSCSYCQNALSAVAGLKRYFNHTEFRCYNGQDLQQQAAESAIAGESLLAIFPTGGGKSIAFQVPALIAGERAKALTVVISPLQSLMKDQVDNLEAKGITKAVTVNGLLDPIQRKKALARVQEGSASLLYISPESLRSATIEKLLLERNIARFVIDEAHCFSAWGQDFRVDYLYIGKFIRALCAQKQLETPIPVSCFTATAKRQVIEDICAYFKKELGVTLTRFIAPVTRHNLHYQVVAQANEEEKYQTLRHLIETHDCPTIVYVSRTKHTALLSEKLQQDGFTALSYHGKMATDLKIEHQNAFKADEVKVMVATSAFGMGKENFMLPFLAQSQR